jgi:tetratricopeptide (TPR) repeat protein
MCGLAPLPLLLAITVVSFAQQPSPEVFPRDSGISIGAPNDQQLAAFGTYLNLTAFHQARHQYGDAEKYCQLAHEIAKSVFGEQSSETAMTISKLGQIRFMQGRIQEADSSFHLALGILESDTNAKKTDIAVVLNNLAQVRQMTGSLSDAEALIRRVIEIFGASGAANERAFGVATHNLATILAERGRLPEARVAAERAVSILERCSNSDDFAMSLVTLGQLESAHRDHVQAEATFQRALRTLQPRSENDNPIVAQVLDNLGVLYHRTGRNIEAERVFERSIEISRRLLGPDHPYLLSTMLDYAAFLRATNRGNAARKLEAYVHEHYKKYRLQNPSAGNVIDVRALARERRY